MDATVLISIIGSLTTIILAGLNFFKDKKMKLLSHELERKASKEKETEAIKAGVLDSFLQMSVYSKINDTVNELFSGTKIDRFMIFIAVNGVSDFNMVSIIFERYKDINCKVNALARYSNVRIDEAYKAMLKEAEKNTYVNIKTDELQSCMLKDIYDYENIKHSIIGFLFRKHIDIKNDLICFVSAATKEDASFTNIEKIQLKTCLEGTIVPLLIETLD